MEDAICVLWPDTLIFQYGSYAVTGMMTPDSDVDVMVSVQAVVDATHAFSLVSKATNSVRNPDFGMETSSFDTVKNPSMRRRTGKLLDLIPN